MGTGTTAEKILINYSGSTALSFLCDSTNLSIDQINFISMQILSLGCSLFMKRFIRDPQKRLVFTLICGVFVTVFCFGNQIFHIISSAGISFLIIKTAKFDNSSRPWLVLIISMVYLSMLHLYRQYIALNYALDITGPIMILVQKISALAWSLQDAVDEKKKDKEMTDTQKKYLVTEPPSALEYWSFIFQFQSMLAGPLVMFRDFREFIHASEFPSPFHAVVKKICVSVLFALVFIKVTPVYNIDRIRDSDFLWNTTFLYRMFYTTIATMMERAKYYHAWILADAVCNASGLGYDTQTKTWDMVTNVDALKFELSLNFKESLDVWNIGTMKWLRHVVYERVKPSIRTVATYSMSAIWHGFYPGYFITFLSGALFTSAGRHIRREIRPFFLKDKRMKLFYDFITWLVTRFGIAYLTFSFVILDFMPSILLYARLYFCFHFAAFGAIFMLPKLSKGVKKGAPRPTGQKQTLNSCGPVPDTDKRTKSKPFDTNVTPSTPPTTTKRNGNNANDSEYSIKSRKQESLITPHDYPEIKSYLKSTGDGLDVWTTWTLNSQQSNANIAT